MKEIRGNNFSKIKVWRIKYKCGKWLKNCKIKPPLLRVLNMKCQLYTKKNRIPTSIPWKAYTSWANQMKRIWIYLHPMTPPSGAKWFLTQIRFWANLYYTKVIPNQLLATKCHRALSCLEILRALAQMSWNLKLSFVTHRWVDSLFKWTAQRLEGLYQARVLRKF
jgi:hypothetical protein